MVYARLSDADDLIAPSQYWRTTWSIWALMIAWLFGPFWFNPLAFDHNKMKKDLHSWLRWMERKDAAALSSWESWWREEQARLRERERD